MKSLLNSCAQLLRMLQLIHFFRAFHLKKFRCKWNILYHHLYVAFSEKILVIGAIENVNFRFKADSDLSDSGFLFYLFNLSWHLINWFLNGKAVKFEIIILDCHMWQADVYKNPHSFSTYMNIYLCVKSLNYFKLICCTNL